MTTKVDELREAFEVNWLNTEGASSDVYNKHAKLDLAELIDAAREEERGLCASALDMAGQHRAAQLLSPTPPKEPKP